MADVEATVAFYGEVLGAEPMYLEEFRAGKMPIVMMQVGANRINLHPRRRSGLSPCPPAHPGSVDLCFRWAARSPRPSPPGRLRRRRSSKAPPPAPPATASAANSVYFRDTDGNLLELLTIKG